MTAAVPTQQRPTRSAMTLAQFGAAVGNTSSHEWLRDYTRWHGAETVTPPDRAWRQPRAADLIAHSIRRAVLSQRIAVETRLPGVHSLASFFGVSKPVVVEALRTLQSEGIVDMRRGGALHARLPDIGSLIGPARQCMHASGATVEDIATARQVIEPVAARLLANHGSAAAHDQLTEAIEIDLPNAWAAAQFGQAVVRVHDLVVQLCGNTTLVVLVSMLRRLAPPAPLPDCCRESYHRSIATYRHLLSLIRNREGLAVEQQWHQLLIDGHPGAQFSSHAAVDGRAESQSTAGAANATSHRTSEER
jgi:GntR family transcriptional repressor for pyruvate dehydrogenase complex